MPPERTELVLVPGRRNNLLIAAANKTPNTTLAATSSQVGLNHPPALSQDIQAARVTRSANGLQALKAAESSGNLYGRFNVLQSSRQPQSGAIPSPRMAQSCLFSSALVSTFPDSLDPICGPHATLYSMAACMDKQTFLPDRKRSMCAWAGDELLVPR